ncbi:hypothetical protein IHE51_02220 [Candidatus Parvarchaeota archaeon]|uniref:Uncharacterized protein n=1 Tax=Candidatus Acidifodinimicrobium mancum TaxID=2898728 RepID=A0A8T3UTE5_9ARCH|nr:hypothetical protein [Candidatus Acidifodinimicrobium mancum]MBE5729892.1 hypothetical protein [Candidatus Acidifodinimicrobium mancum]
MEDKELKLVYRRAIEGIILYNQYRNNLNFEMSADMGQQLLAVNDMLVLNNIKKGEEINKKIDELKRQLSSSEVS